MHVQLHDLTPALWLSLKKLFGENGACGGCWCMFWRLETGAPYAQLKGPALKRRFKARVMKGEVLGALAFVDREPIGWVTYGPRLTFPRLERSPTLACDDAAQVWSVPCFFIKAGFRQKGVASLLLAHAVERMRSLGAPDAEGYPVKPARDGSPLPANFSYTGTVPMFEKAGFALAANSVHAKVRMRLSLRSGQADARRSSLGPLFSIRGPRRPR
jgi:GNAT superfamily N-acetyltransferase